jgi:hypothetical protein
VVRAANEEKAEAKARAAMRAWHIVNFGDSAGNATEVAQSCAPYEHEEFDGEVIFGGRLLDVLEGSILKAHDLECRLRDLLQQLGNCPLATDGSTTANVKPPAIQLHRSDLWDE